MGKNRTTRLLLQEMTAGTNSSTVFMPWLGEYGVMLMYWVRYIHHYKAKSKFVCCRPGDEPYFPSAQGYIYNWTHPIGDAKRVGTGWRRGSHPAMGELREQIHSQLPNTKLIDPFRLPVFEPFAKLLVPLTPQTQRGLKADVVLGTRQRDYQPQRNWHHWDKLTKTIKDAGLTVGVVGRKDTAFDPDGADIRAWEYDDASANIELLNNCRLYIGTDTGTSHLAALCSAPMLIFRYPGPWQCIDAIHTTTGSSFKYLESAWDSPDIVCQTALEMAIQRNIESYGITQQK